MCEPVTLGAIAIGATALGTGVQVYGSIKRGQYEQQLANEQARVQEAQAATALQQGAAAAGVTRMKASQEIARARAEAGASGIDMTTGGALEVIADASMLSELDAQTIKNNAARDAWGYRKGAAVSRAQGAASASAGTWDAVSTLIGGAAKTAFLTSDWYRWRMKGTTDDVYQDAGLFRRR